MATTASAERRPAGRGRSAAHRDISTPEGVALPVDLASRGERAAAFLIDLLIIIGCFIGIVLLALRSLIGVSGAEDGSHWFWIAC